VGHQVPVVQLELLVLQANQEIWGNKGTQGHLVSVSVVQKGSEDLMDYLALQVIRHLL